MLKLLQELLRNSNPIKGLGWQNMPERKQILPGLVKALKAPVDARMQVIQVLRQRGPAPQFGRARTHWALERPDAAHQALS
jgi:hypothetical protein